MKNGAKRSLSLLLAIIMMFSMVPAVAFTASASSTVAVANSEAAITVNSAWGGLDDTVTVDVKIADNPGILGGTLTVSWSDKLTMVSDASGEAFFYMTYTAPSQYKASGTNFVWYANDVGEVVDGTILTLTFTVSADAHSDENLFVNVTYKDGDVFDANENPVTLNITNGSVRAVKYIPGDTTNDGRINMLDVVNLSRYISDGNTTDPDGYNVTVDAGASDANGDGRINMLDVVNLSRYISDGNTTDPDGYNVALVPAKETETEHVLGDWVIVKDATETENGLKERTCSCGGKDTEIIPMIEVTEPEDTEAPEPEVTEPEVTEPEVTEPEVTEPEPEACATHTAGIPVYDNSVITVICDDCGELIWTTSDVLVEKWSEINDGNGFTQERTIDIPSAEINAANEGGYAIVLNYKLSEITNPDSEVSILSAVAKRGTDYYIPVFLRQAVVDGKLVMKIANAADAPYFELEANVEYNIIIVVDPNANGITEHVVYVNGRRIGSITQGNKIPADADEIAQIRINDGSKNKSKTFITDLEVLAIDENFIIPELSVGYDCGNHETGTPIYDGSAIYNICDNCGCPIWKSTGVALEKLVDTNGGSGFSGERPYDQNDKPAYMVSKDVVSKANKGGYAIYFKYKLGAIAEPDTDNKEVSILSVVAKRGTDSYIPVFLRQAVIDNELVMKIANAADAPYFKLTADTEYEIVILVDPNGEHTVYVDGALVGSYNNSIKIPADVDDSVYFRINDQWKNKCTTFINHFEVFYLDAMGDEPVIPEETEPEETEPVETEPYETEPVETEPVETEPVETEPEVCVDHVVGVPVYNNSTVALVCDNCDELIWKTSEVVVEKWSEINNGNGFSGERTINATVDAVSATNEGGYAIVLNYKLSNIVNPESEVSILSAVAKRGTDYYIPVFLRQAVVDGELVMKISSAANAPYFKLEANEEYNIIIVVDPSNESGLTEHAVYVNGAKVGSITQATKVPADAESVYFRINDQYKNKSTTFITDFEVMTVADGFVIPEAPEAVDCDDHTVGTPVYDNSIVKFVCNNCGEPIWKTAGVAVEKWVDTNDGNGFTGERKIDTTADVVSKANKGGYAIVLNYKLGDIVDPEKEVSILSVVASTDDNYTVPVFLRQMPDGNGGLKMKIANSSSADVPVFDLEAGKEYKIIIIVDPNNANGKIESTVYVDGDVIGSFEHTQGPINTSESSYYFRINDQYNNKSKTFINHFEVLYLNEALEAPEIVVPTCDGHTLSAPVYEGSKIKMYCEDCKAEAVVASGVAVEKQDIDNGEAFTDEKRIATDAKVVSPLNENGYAIRFNYTVDSVVANGEVSVLTVVGYDAEGEMYIPIFLRQYSNSDGVILRIAKGDSTAPGVKLFAGMTYEILVLVDIEDETGMTKHSVYVDGNYIGSSNLEPAGDNRVISTEANNVYFRINDSTKNKSSVRVTDFEVLYTEFDFNIGDETYVDIAASFDCAGHAMTNPVYEDSKITMYCEDCGKDVYVASVPTSEKWTDTNGGNGFSGERQIATSASVVSKLNSTGYAIRFNYKLNTLVAPESDVALLTLVSSKGNATYTTPCFIRQYPDGNGGVVFRIARDETAPEFTLVAGNTYEIMIFVLASNTTGMMEYFVYVDGAFVGSYEQQNEVVTSGSNYYFRINDGTKNKNNIGITEFETLYLNGDFDVKDMANTPDGEVHSISTPTYSGSKITAYCSDCGKNVVITSGVGVAKYTDTNNGNGFTGERTIDVKTDLVATDDGLGYAIRFNYKLNSLVLPTVQDEVSVLTIVTTNASGDYVMPVFLRQFSIGGELYLKTKSSGSAPGFKLEANKDYEIMILVNPTNEAGTYRTALYVDGAFIGSTAYGGSDIITSDMTGCYIRINDGYKNLCSTQIKDLEVLYMNANYNVLDGGDPWEVADEAVNTWLARWEVIKQGGDKKADTLDYGVYTGGVTHPENTDNYPFGNNKYYEYQEISWIRKSAGGYTRNISRLVSTLKDYTYNNNETSNYDIYGGYTANGTIAEATGYFYTTKIGDRWWTVDPLGYPFFRTAMNEVTGGVSHTQKENVISRHGTLAAWAESATEKLQALGYNSMGAWSDVANLTAVENSTPLTETKIIGVLSKYASSTGVNTTSGGSTTLEGSIMPVFDPAFETLADWYVYQETYGQKFNPNVYGWMSDNELPDDDEMLDAILALENPMSTAYAYTYATAITFLKAKGIENPTVDDLTDELRREFKAMTYDKYYEVVVKALEKHVPNHQYLGCRLLPENWKQEEFMRVSGYWCDIISINYYGSWTPNPEMTHNWLLWAGKPFISTEWYAMAREDSGLESTSGAGFTVQTQSDRAEFYQNYSLALLEFKGCVGFDWFKMWDNDPNDLAGIANDSSNADGNKGIYSTDYKEWTTLTDAMGKVNNNKYSLIKFFDARP